MKILVIDDNATNQQSAIETLEGHDVTVATTYDEGRKLLGGMGPYGREKLGSHSFDAVLTDLLMPAGNEDLLNKELRGTGKEEPVGIFLALLAARNGAKFVGMLSSKGHHDHWALACLDNFGFTKGYTPLGFQMGDTKILLTYSVDTKRGWDQGKDWDALLKAVMEV